MAQRLREREKREGEGMRFVVPLIYVNSEHLSGGHALTSPNRIDIRNYNLKNETKIFILTCYFI